MLLLDHLADIVQRVDGANRTTWISPSLERLTGWAVEECLGDTRWDLVHPDDAPMVAELVVGLRSGRLPEVRTEVRLRVRDGSYLWWAVTARCLGDDPATSDVVLAFRNVDAEVRQRDEARRQEDLRLATLASMLDPLVLLAPVWGPGGQIVTFAYAEVNAAAGDYLGREPQDLQGRALEDVLDPAAADELLRLCVPVAENSVSVTRVDHAMAGTPRTGVRRLDLRLWPVEGLVGLTWRDVTDRYEAGQALTAEYGLLRATVNASLDPHVLLQAVRDASGAIVDFSYLDANDAACAYNRTSRADLLGATVMELLPAHRDTGLLDRYIEVVETGRPLVLDDFSYPHDILAEPRRFDIRAVKVGDCLSYTWRDVTDRSRATSQVAEANARLASMLDTMAEGVIVVDEAGRIVQANAAARRITGLSQDQMTGMVATGGGFRLVRPDGSDLPPEHHPLSVALFGGEPVTDTVVGLIDAGGTTTWITTAAQSLPGAGGRPGGAA